MINRLRKGKFMKIVLMSIVALFILPTTSMATVASTGWQSEVISLVSNQRFKEAGEKIKEYCVEKKNSELCLILAAAYFDGEAKFGINSRDIIEAYKYTRLACDYGSEAGCQSSKAAIEKGELVQNVLFEPGVENRDAQLKEAIQLGADLNATTLVSRTLLSRHHVPNTSSSTGGQPFHDGVETHGTEKQLRNKTVKGGRDEENGMHRFVLCVGAMTIREPGRSVRRACLRAFDPVVRDPQMPGGVGAGFVVRMFHVREPVASQSHGRHGQRRHLDVVLDIHAAQGCVAR